MTEWTKVGIDIGMGGAAGAADQLVQNMDEKRALEERAAGKLGATEKLPMMRQTGTYLNYGIPILAVLAAAMGWVKGDMETRVATIGGQLAGRKLTHQLSTGATSATPSAAYTAWQRAQAQAAANQRNKAERTYETEAKQIGVF
jgi:hypothetical protein